MINICEKQKPIFLGLPKTPIFNFPDTLSRSTFKIITYASRAVTDVEKRYGPIEREFLAIQYGCFRSEIYLLGRDFEVITDHKPLVSLYNNPRRPGPFRVVRMRPKLQGFSFTLQGRIPAREAESRRLYLKTTFTVDAQDKRSKSLQN